MDLKAFIDADKSLIIAPAGFGKTHTIIEALKTIVDPYKVLVLTHTHAGIASIREKAKKEQINPSNFTLDTICSFALFLTKAFIKHKDLMPQPEDEYYFPFAVSKATKLLKANPVKYYLSCTYSHLIVDEYQDCTLLQHGFVLRLSEVLKTHILGDPLQGIFDFNDTLVDLDSNQHMTGFNENVQRLVVPWRWKNNNEQLGADLALIRSEVFEQNNQLDLTKYRSICFQSTTNQNDIYDYNSNAYQWLSNFIKKRSPNSLLVVVPENHNVKPFANRFKTQFGIQELNAFDENWYYECSRLIDSNNGNNTHTIIHEVLLDLFPKIIVEQWINGKHHLKNKLRVQSPDSEFYNSLHTLYISSVFDMNWMIKVVSLFKNHYFRHCKLEKTNAIIKAMKIAMCDSVSVHEGMKQDRDIARRVGRKVYGRYVGTTLLTKGLEFDTVIVMNPNSFANKKHLYVALTRATNCLIVFSTTSKINL